MNSAPQCDTNFWKWQILSHSIANERHCMVEKKDLKFEHECDKRYECAQNVGGKGNEMKINYFWLITHSHWSDMKR